MDDLEKKYLPYFRLLYEDNHLFIVSKPSGMLVQGDETGDKPLPEYIKDFLREKYAKPGNIFCGVVHRLDRPVTGLVIFAKTSKALERMNAKFQEKDIRKTYWAIVKNKPQAEEGRLIHWLKKNQEKNITTAYTKELTGSQRAELTYSLLASINGYNLLEVKPLTGRPHQIRVQLASMNCPIRGDVKYGYPEGNKDNSICLHARRIEFAHPVKAEPIELEAPLPEKSEWQLFKTFG